MAVRSEFVENLKEVFAQFGPIEIKAMFGGHGVYCDGLMFALVADDVLYLKADEQSLHRFTDAGLAQFEYAKDGKHMKMSYWEAPEVVFDEPDEASEWARLAFDAALRASRTKKKVPRKSR